MSGNGGMGVRMGGFEGAVVQGRLVAIGAGRKRERGGEGVRSMEGPVRDERIEEEGFGEGSGSESSGGTSPRSINSAFSQGR